MDAVELDVLLAILLDVRSAYVPVAAAAAKASSVVFVSRVICVDFFLYHDQ